jgi:hypothetical protein
MPKLSTFFDLPALKKQQDSQGRIRTTPHKENSWAVHIYAIVNLKNEKLNILKNLNGIHEISEQHVSLSRCVFLKEHQLEPFSRNIQSCLSNIKRFKISFAQLAQLTNDEKTRSFLTLEIGQGYQEVRLKVI